MKNCDRKKFPLDRFPWKDMEYDNLTNQMNTRELCEKYAMSTNQAYRAKKRGFLKYQSPKKRPRMSDSTKRKISDARKRFLKENPDAHSWKRKGKFKSLPCEHFKEKLRQGGISFVEEFNPIGDRFFSIDVAIPEKMIGIEINGNQHYERTGELKPYYKKRHDIIESNGWTLYELHFSLVWNDEIFESMVKTINSGEYKFEFDYAGYASLKLKTVGKKKKCINCGTLVFKTSTRCRNCNSKHRISANNKSNRPTKEILQELYNKMPMTKIAKLFGVSDVAIKKWIKECKIPTENRLGYWAKKHSMPYSSIG